MFAFSNRLRGHNANNNDRVYDKFQEHMDQSPLGKIQQQYWTARQLVLKKLGKKEDEFVMLSDAELDAKLEVSAISLEPLLFASAGCLLFSSCSRRSS